LSEKKLNHREMALRVCVDRVQNGQISGRVYGGCLEKGLNFTDIANFLLQVEAILDQKDFPRAFQRKRTFNHSKETVMPVPVPGAEGIKNRIGGSDSLQQQGLVFTFMVYVVTRQSTTWQGLLDWLDGQPRQNFQSALELIRLTDHMLAQKFLPETQKS